MLGKRAPYALIAVVVLVLLFAIHGTGASGSGHQPSLPPSSDPPTTAQAAGSTSHPSSAAPSASASTPTAPSPPTGGPSYDKSRDWPLAYFHAGQLWHYTEGAGVTVAIVGTGIDFSHPDLAGAYALRVDWAGGPQGDESGNSIGTEIAALIAGRGTPGNPAGVPGLAPEAKLIDVRVTADESTVTAAEITEGIQSAATRGAQIIDVPLGIATDNSQLDAAAESAAAAGCLVIASANPDGKPQYPADSPGVLAVAAVTKAMTPTGSLKRYGPHAVYAPGTGLYSADKENGYQEHLSGNDLATAYVAGAAALFMVPRLGQTASDVETLLVSDASGGGATGIGVLDPLQVLRAVLAAPPHPPHPTPTPAPRPSQHVAVGQGGGTNVEWKIVFILALFLLVLLVGLGFLTRGRGPRPPRGPDAGLPRAWDLEPR